MIEVRPAPFMPSSSTTGMAAFCAPNKALPSPPLPAPAPVGPPKELNSRVAYSVTLRLLLPPVVAAASRLLLSRYSDEKWCFWLEVMLSSKSMNVFLHTTRTSWSSTTHLSISIDPCAMYLYTWIGRSLPFTLMGAMASTRGIIPAGRRECVVTSIRTPPCALPISRAAIFTTLPIAAYSIRTSEPTVPQYTSPVVIPNEQCMDSLRSVSRICAAEESALSALSR
mmetsp:Transcript_26015/g.43343  ORF Transcript_26015/g.43343 Transcript_26015/m.43343 type:complete len:225 (+) Transcript_26015:2611-3285(+)